MKNRLINKFTISLLVVTFALSFTSCNDWTDPENVEIKEPNLEQDNPELYAQYLAALREYKQRAGHKVVYAWFDNSLKNTVTRAHHITTLPDSVDVITLMYADNLVERELNEMNKVRQKGTRVIYNISYDALTEAYKAYREAFDAATPPQPTSDEEGDDTTPEVAKTLAEFTAEYMPAQIDLCAKYNYDGIVVSYNGKELTHSTPEQIAQYTAEQEAFLNPIAEWQKANTGKMLVLMGRAYNILNKELVQQFEHIIVPTQYLTSTASLSFELRKSLVEGVPADRFVTAVLTTSLDKSDTKTGYFGSQRALTETAYWISTPESGLQKAGIAIFDVQNDFYNTTLLYKYTREAIAIMN